MNNITISLCVLVLLGCLQYCVCYYRVEESRPVKCQLSVVCQLLSTFCGVHRYWHETENVLQWHEHDWLSAEHGLQSLNVEHNRCGLCTCRANGIIGKVVKEGCYLLSNLTWQQMVHFKLCNCRSESVEWSGEGIGNTHTCTCTHECACMRAHTHTHTHRVTFMHAHTHTHTHVHVCTPYDIQIPPRLHQCVYIFISTSNKIQ